MQSCYLSSSAKYHTFDCGFSSFNLKDTWSTTSWTMAFSTSVLVAVNRVPHADIIYTVGHLNRGLLPLSMVTQEIQLNPQGQKSAQGSNRFLVGTEVVTVESSVLFLLTTGVVVFCFRILFSSLWISWVGWVCLWYRTDHDSMILILASSLSVYCCSTSFSSCWRLYILCFQKKLFLLEFQTNPRHLRFWCHYLFCCMHKGHVHGLLLLLKALYMSVVETVGMSMVGVPLHKTSSIFLLTAKHIILAISTRLCMELLIVYNLCWYS